MKIGEIAEVTIDAAGMNGEGIARVEGMVVFVPYTLVGERVKVRFTEIGKRYSRAKVIKVLSGAEARVSPVCADFFRCGGCEMQHIDYSSQLAIKRATVADCLRKACRTEIAVAQTVASPLRFGYRNKVQIPLARVGDRIVGGYYRAGTHDLVPFSDACPLHTARIERAIESFFAYANEAPVSVYEEATGKGCLRHLVVRQVGEALAVTVVVNGKSLPAQALLVEKLRSRVAEFSLFLSENSRRTNVIMGDSVRCLWGEERLRGEKCGVRFCVSPRAFFQINDAISDRIYRHAVAALGGTGVSVIDAYSGIGITSNLLAAAGCSVFAVEEVPEAVADAEDTARRNGNRSLIENYCGDVAQVLPKIAARIAKSRPEHIRVLLDPPRRGCAESVVREMAKLSPERIVYISCNPATLARDLALLAQDYGITEVTPYDMFPQTGAVETLAVLDRKSALR